jgi:hypothetical protein
MDTYDKVNAANQYAPAVYSVYTNQQETEDLP